MKDGTAPHQHSPGETLTPVVPEDCEEMITFFNITDRMYYVDEDDENIGYEYGFTKIDMCPKEYSETGLTAVYVDRFIRWST